MKICILWFYHNFDSHSENIKNTILIVLLVVDKNNYTSQFCIKSILLVSFH